MDKEEIIKIFNEELPRIINEVVNEIKDKDLELRGLIKIIGSELNIGGGRQITGIEGGYQTPLVILDDPGADSKRVGGIGVATLLKGLDTEQMNVVIVVETVEKFAPSNLAGNKSAPKQSANIVNLSEIILSHSTFDDVGYNSFFYGMRMPIATGKGRVALGGTVLTDLTQNWEVDELVGATLYLTGSVTEAYIILSNTTNTITITGGTWQSASNEYTYQVSRPIYLGAANGPWRRLYVKDDIRFGIGPSDGAYPTTGKTVFRLIKESDRALSCEGAIGSKKQATTVGAGFTLTWTSGYHVLTGTASRTSDVTTAITSGAFAGQILILQGTSDTNTIIIKNGANTKLTGDITLGAEDTLTLVWDGTKWVEITSSNNI